MAVTFLDNLQNGPGREPDGCVVCFDEPRFVPFHADSDIVTDPGFPSVGIKLDVRVYREATRRRETGVKSDEYCFDRRPSLITGLSRVAVEAVGYAILPPFDCSARFRHG